MSSHTETPLAACASVQEGRPAGTATEFMSKVGKALIRGRIALSISLIAIVIAEDMLIGERPHSILNLADAWTTSGLILILMGILLRSWAAGALHKNRCVTTSGPYALTRNPLYVGSYLMILGFCLLVGDWDNCVGVSLLAALIYWPTIKKEEIYLSKKFGDQWNAYAASTPRLFPRLSFNASAIAWSWRQWLKNKEYRAVLGTSLGLWAVKTWYDMAG